MPKPAWATGAEKDRPPKEAASTENTKNVRTGAHLRLFCFRVFIADIMIVVTQTLLRV
jgi:hypothetical protein